MLNHEPEALKQPCIVLLLYLKWGYELWEQQRVQKPEFISSGYTKNQISRIQVSKSQSENYLPNILWYWPCTNSFLCSASGLQVQDKIPESIKKVQITDLKKCEQLTAVISGLIDASTYQPDNQFCYVVRSWQSHQNFFFFWQWQQEQTAIKKILYCHKAT